MNLDSTKERCSEELTDSLPPEWLRASVDEFEKLDFEKPITGVTSAANEQLSALFRTAAEEGADGPAIRVYRMLSAATGMMLSAKSGTEPYRAMVIFADGRRSPVPADFRGAPENVLTLAAERAQHPVLKARLADLCWLLDRKRGRLGLAAVAAYVETVRRVDDGSLALDHDQGRRALDHEVRDLLRRALSISRSVGWDKPEALAARAMVNRLREQALLDTLPIPAFWFCELDLDFGVSDPATIGRQLEPLIARLPSDTDGHNIVNLWRLTARAYHAGKCDNDRHRAQAAAAEQFARMADSQPLAMMASSFLSDAIAELHGIPGAKERRKELRHRLIDVQSNIAEEMSPFSYPLDLEDIAKQVEQAMGVPSLRDKLFVFAALAESPDPAKLADDAARSIREHPLSSLFGTSNHDREGKVVHRTDGAGFGDNPSSTAILNHIAQHEGLRRQITASGQIEVARQAIARDHFLSEDVFLRLFSQSAFVPADLRRTFSHGFLRFFQGDFTSALYILSPLLENSLRYVLKGHGHDATIFDDATQTQQDRTISSLFEQMRTELDAILGHAITTDIENVFLRKPGPHLRHALAHGLLHDGDPYGSDAVYACWLMFRLCLIPLFPYREQIILPFD